MDFEQHISNLLDYQESPRAALSAHEVIAGARHRRRFRALLGGGVVAGISIGAAAVLPNVLTTPDRRAAFTAVAASSTAPGIARSQIRTVSSGAEVHLAGGTVMTVNATTECSWSAEATRGCHDVTSPNMTQSGPSLDIQTGGDPEGSYVVCGEYQGSSIPAAIVVVSGKTRTTATIVETSGMRAHHWVAYYATVPSMSPHVITERQTFAASMPRAYAYDAQGRLLVQMPQVSALR